MGMMMLHIVYALVTAYLLWRFLKEAYLLALLIRAVSRDRKAILAGEPREWSS